jgi:hypothetical protein
MFKPRHHYSLIALAAAGLLLTGLAGAARAQSQDDSAKSVAEAARRARENKKAAAKPAKTLTEDDLPAAPAAGSTEPSAPASPAKTDENAAAPTAPTVAKPADAASAEKAKLVHAANVAALERAKKSLAQFESELDVMQRKAKLDSESYYSKPDFSSDTAGKANLDAEAQEITTKQQDIEILKARIAELQAAVDVGAPPATESKPPAEEKPPSQ